MPTHTLEAALAATAKAGDAEQLQNALHAGALINFRQPDTGRSALHEACAAGHTEVAELLVKLGADVHKSTFLGAQSSLHLATMSSSRYIVQALLQAGAAVNQLDKYRNVPLHLVTRIDIAKVLLRHGGGAALKNKFGKTPLQK
jgi:26S proteasome non-ATPase regulatory subunit 10